MNAGASTGYTIRCFFSYWTESQVAAEETSIDDVSTFRCQVELSWQEAFSAFAWLMLVACPERVLARRLDSLAVAACVVQDVIVPIDYGRPYSVCATPDALRLVLSGLADRALIERSEQMDGDAWVLTDEGRSRLWKQNAAMCNDQR